MRNYDLRPYGFRSNVTITSLINSESTSKGSVVHNEIDIDTDIDEQKYQHVYVCVCTYVCVCVCDRIK